MQLTTWLQQFSLCLYLSYLNSGILKKITYIMSFFYKYLRMYV